MAERSHPTSKVRGRSREDHMPEGRWPRGATPRPRSGGAAGRCYPMPLSWKPGATAGRNAPMPEARGSGREEQPMPEARGGNKRSYPEPWLQWCRRA